jgi:hypothetical protein
MSNGTDARIVAHAHGSRVSCPAAREGGGRSENVLFLPMLAFVAYLRWPLMP